jgi:hypothetical protein
MSCITTGLNCQSPSKGRWDRHDLLQPVINAYHHATQMLVMYALLDANESVPGHGIVNANKAEPGKPCQEMRLQEPLQNPYVQESLAVMCAIASLQATPNKEPANNHFTDVAQYRMLPLPVGSAHRAMHPRSVNGPKNGLKTGRVHANAGAHSDIRAGLLHTYGQHSHAASIGPEHDPLSI